MELPSCTFLKVIHKIKKHNKTMSYVTVNYLWMALYSVCVQVIGPKRDKSIVF